MSSPSQKRKRMSSFSRETILTTSLNQVCHPTYLACKFVDHFLQPHPSKVSAAYETRISVNSWTVSTCQSAQRSTPSKNSHRFLRTPSHYYAVCNMTSMPRFTSRNDLFCCVCPHLFRSAVVVNNIQLLVVLRTSALDVKT